MSSFFLGIDLDIRGCGGWSPDNWVSPSVAIRLRRLRVRKGDGLPLFGLVLCWNDGESVRILFPELEDGACDLPDSILPAFAKMHVRVWTEEPFRLLASIEGDELTPDGDLPDASETCGCEHRYKRGACPFCDAAYETQRRR